MLRHKHGDKMQIDTDGLCRKCLVPDFFEDKERFLSLSLARIAPDLRTHQEIYEKRLESCGNCRHLLNGVCRLCGCFIAVRAAVASNTCPDVHSRW